MKYFWIVLNLTLVGLAFWGGYNSMTPDKLSHTNPDPLACLLILLTTPFLAIGSAMYSITRCKAAPLSRPSWNRNPLNWGRDPLQSLFFLHMCICGNGYWKCGPSSSLRLSRVLDRGSVLFLRHRTIGWTGCRVSEISRIHLKSHHGTGAHIIGECRFD